MTQAQPAKVLNSSQSRIAKMESGDIYFPKNAMWLGNVQTELLRFPEAEHDDIVDSLAYAVLETKRRKTLKAW